jgi:hypothetical protein
MTNRSTFFVCFTGLTSFACSSTSDGAPADQSPIDASASAADGEGSPQDSGAGTSKDASGSDAALSPDGSGPTDADADTAALAPHPPSGATKCGSGTFTANDSTAACQSDPTLGPLAYPRDCTSFVIAGGEFEVWCSSTQTYLWARFDGAGVKTPYQCTAVFDGSVVSFDPPLQIIANQGEIHGASGGTSFSNWGSGDGVLLTYGTPGSFAVDATVSGAFPTGKATIWVVTEQLKCPGGAELPMTTRAGAPFSW